MNAPPAIADRLDAETLAALSGTLPRVLGPGDLTIAEVRAADALLSARRAEPAASGAVPSEHVLTRIDGGELRIRLHDAPGAGGILWIHGGGMFLGSAEADDALCRSMREDLGVAVAAVHYRLAPEHRHPEPLQDCLRGLEWLAERGGPIVVAGLSAGGGLALAVALHARDHGSPQIAAIHAYYPMLDDRPTSSRAELAETEVWDARLDRLAWSAYLGDADADAYAAPARAGDLRGLPPVHLDTGEFDLFRSEDEEFAARLSASGVPVEFVLHAGAVHAHELVVPESARAAAIWDRRFASLRKVFANGKDTRVAL